MKIKRTMWSYIDHLVLLSQLRLNQGSNHSQMKKFGTQFQQIKFIEERNQMRKKMKNKITEITTQ